MHTPRLSYLVFLALAVAGLMAVSPRTQGDEASPAPPPAREGNPPTDTAGLIALLDRFSSVKDDPADIPRLIDRLGADDFKAREEASEKLVAFGPKALPQLHRATNNKDTEVANRAADCIEAI